MTVVFASVHVDLVNEPGEELVAIVMLVIVELPVASAHASYESSVIYDSSVPLGILHALE